MGRFGFGTGCVAAPLDHWFIHMTSPITAHDILLTSEAGTLVAWRQQVGIPLGDDWPLPVEGRYRELERPSAGCGRRDARDHQCRVFLSEAIG